MFEARGKKDWREEKKNICGWAGLGLEKKGMGEGDCSEL